MLSLNTDVNVPTVRNKYKKKLEKHSFFCWHLESHCQKGQDPDPFASVWNQGSVSVSNSPGSGTLLEAVADAADQNVSVNKNQ